MSSGVKSATADHLHGKLRILSVFHEASAGATYEREQCCDLARDRTASFDKTMPHAYTANVATPTAGSRR
jgi:hypothetical protein